MIKHLTEKQVEDLRAGGTRLAPGVWMDKDDALHFSVPELLEYFHVADTPANRAMAVESIREAIATAWPDEQIVVQDVV